MDDRANINANGPAVKITCPNQFSPPNPNAYPREFKQRQQLMKERRMMGVISPGPQSQILENSFGKIIPAEGRGTVLIGTASKGIIERRQQQNAQVYRQLYAPNPFSSTTDYDLSRYAQEVETKIRSKSTQDLNRKALPCKQNGSLSHGDELGNNTVEGFFEQNKATEKSRLGT